MAVCFKAQIDQWLPVAVHVLDRFHVVRNLMGPLAEDNDRGLPTSVTDGLGRRTTIAYNGDVLVTVVADPVAASTTTYEAGSDRVSPVSRPITPGPGTHRVSFSYGDPANPGRVTAVVERLTQASSKFGGGPPPRSCREARSGLITPTK